MRAGWSGARTTRVELQDAAVQQQHHPARPGSSDTRGQAAWMRRSPRNRPDIQGAFTDGQAAWMRRTPRNPPDTQGEFPKTQAAWMRRRPAIHPTPNARSRNLQNFSSHRERLAVGEPQEGETAAKAGRHGEADQGTDERSTDQ